MITDEQAKIAIEAYWSNETDELPAMRKALEAYEASKWVKFDEYDSSTYPPVLPERYLLRVKDDTDEVVAECTCGYVNNILAYTWREGNEQYPFTQVTHWQPLPEFKE